MSRAAIVGDLAAELARLAGGLSSGILRTIFISKWLFELNWLQMVA